MYSCIVQLTDDVVIKCSVKIVSIGLDLKNWYNCFYNSNLQSLQGSVRLLASQFTRLFKASINIMLKYGSVICLLWSSSLTACQTRDISVC